jgi:hypothetical protein
MLPRRQREMTRHYKLALALFLPAFFSATAGTWTSSNPLVITIDQTGYGLALTAGTTIIRYTSPNGVAFSEWIMYVGQGT